MRDTCTRLRPLCYTGAGLLFTCLLLSQEWRGYGRTITCLLVYRYVVRTARPFPIVWAHLGSRLYRTLQY